MTNVTTHVGYKNPYRYRGYRYDSETQLYYLQSRYYNPSWERFINADDADILHLTQGELLGANLFSYCVNNPIMNSDPSGYLHFGETRYNTVRAIALLVDLLIITVPALWSLRSFMKAETVALNLAKQAEAKALQQLKNRSKKAIEKMFVELSVKVSQNNMPKLGSVLRGLSGAVINGIFTVTGSSMGQVVAKLLDRVDGSVDGYIFK